MPDPVREETGGGPPERVFVYTDGDILGWQILDVPDPAGRVEIDKDTTYFEYVRAASAFSSKDEGDAWQSDAEIRAETIDEVARELDKAPELLADVFGAWFAAKGRRPVTTPEWDFASYAVDRICNLKMACRSLRVRQAHGLGPVAPSVSQQAEDDEFAYTEERASSACTCRRGVSQQGTGERLALLLLSSLAERAAAFVALTPDERRLGEDYEALCDGIDAANRFLTSVPSQQKGGGHG